jgi:hypothetical protein
MFSRSSRQKVAEEIVKRLINCIAYLHGLKRGARLKAPVDEINGWKASVRKKTEGGLSG